jgi:hypothetical protein
MGAALTQAQSWLAKRPDDLSPADRNFIDQSAILRSLSSFGFQSSVSTLERKVGPTSTRLAKSPKLANALRLASLPNASSYDAPRRTGCDGRQLGQRSSQYARAGQLRIRIGGESGSHTRRLSH